MNKKEITFYSRLVREAIERIDKKSLSPQFRMFPGGACGAASDVLGTYLDELGFTPIFRVLKYCRIPDQNQSHVWLEYDNLLIDITADQFNNHNQISPVFGFRDSVHVTEDPSIWYNVFDYDPDKDRRKAHYRVFEEFGDPRTVNLIKGDYLKILEQIPKDHWPDSWK
ncbi:MAG: hypothetical protein GVY20_01555 [Bacteroidetes bacterium]|nr:hypothetical protein [Bacteroidota bacterium]